MDIYALTNAKGETLSKDEVNDLLGDIGISDDAIKAGTDSAIEEDADENKINLDQLTDLAKAKGADIKGAADKSKEDYNRNLQTLGIPADIIAKGQPAIQAYAAQNNIRLPESTGSTLNFKF